MVESLEFGEGIGSSVLVLSLCSPFRFHRSFAIFTVKHEGISLTVWTRYDGELVRLDRRGWLLGAEKRERARDRKTRYSHGQDLSAWAILFKSLGSIVTSVRTFGVLFLFHVMSSTGRVAQLVRASC